MLQQKMSDEGFARKNKNLRDEIYKRRQKKKGCSNEFQDAIAVQVLKMKNIRNDEDKEKW